MAISHTATPKLCLLQLSLNWPRTSPHDCKASCKEEIETSPGRKVGRMGGGCPQTISKGVILADSDKKCCRNVKPVKSN